jgi:peptide/nickel transport system substrate-binding protein
MVKNGKGNIDEIILTPSRRTPTAWPRALGDVDFISPCRPGLRPHQGDDKLQLVTMASARIITFQMNEKKRPEFANLKVREAVMPRGQRRLRQEDHERHDIPSDQNSPKGYAGYNPTLKPATTWPRPRSS